MDLNDYQKEVVTRTAKPVGEMPQLTQAETALNWGVTGLSGEAGEIAELFKKQIYHGHGFDADKWLNELGDALWYLTDIANVLGFTLQEVAEHNRQKLEKRYPEGFNTQDSLERRDTK